MRTSEKISEWANKWLKEWMRKRGFFALFGKILRTESSFVLNWIRKLKFFSGLWYMYVQQKFSLRVLF